MASVSGSAVANVVTTGSFTIPLMKRIGYRDYFAGAVEACASSGGQIMPPVMGAAAFVIAEFLNMPYLKVAVSGLFPALIYFFQSSSWFISRLASATWQQYRKPSFPASRRRLNGADTCLSPSLSSLSC
jgi:TRAP-type uncharacterized transport system fused permease subunit